jgi:GntR family transcriptional regulator
MSRHLAAMGVNHAFSADELSVPDTSSFVPLYMQLATHMATLIREKGERAVGKALPSEAECVQRFGVSRPTVRQAMSYLLSQGLITREKGRGTFVAPLNLVHDVSHGFEDDMHAAHRSVQYTLLGWEKISPPADVAAILGQEAGRECFLLRRLRSVEGEVVGVEERYVPEAIGRHVRRADLQSQPALHLLQRVADQKPRRLDIEVSSIAATKDLARLLTVKTGVPLLVRRTTFLSDSGQPLMHGTVIFLAEHYKFRFTVNYVA